MEIKERSRSIQVKFFISQSEEEQLKSKMTAAGIRNKSAYLRKMALGGYIVTQDYDVVRKATAELHRIGGNVNQIAKVANTYGDVYMTELQKIEGDLAQICQLLLSRA